MKHIYTFDHRKENTSVSINRSSARAVIIKDNLVLMIYLSKTNEYKFPGGGLENNESNEEALIREVLEEAGAKINDVKRCLGYIDQIWPDKYIDGETFYMRNIYYLCTVTQSFDSQKLDKYESELGFIPVWISFDEAIQANQKRLEMGSDYHWTERELFMLKKLKREFPISF